MGTLVVETAPSVRAGVYMATDDLLSTPSAGTIRAGLYERVSRLATAADRVKARSIEQQNAENREACAARGWTVADVYPDAGLSASRFAKETGSKAGGANRAQYRRMLAAVAAGELDVLILWEPSRGNRELEGWAGLLNAARRTGTKIYITSHDREYDLANARDWRSLAEDGIDSQYEAEKISVRIKRGKAAAKAAGRPQGRPIYGTRRIFDPQTRQWLRDEPDPQAAETIVMIKEQSAAGESYAQIAQRLNARGIPSPTGKTWTGMSVGRLAASPVYGRLGMIDPETDARALMRAADNARRNERPSRQMHRYTGVMRCAVCKEPVSAQSRSNERRYYNCRQGHAYVDIAAADARIDDLAIRRLCRPDLADLISRSDSSAIEAAAAQDVIAARGRKKIAEATRAYSADLIGIESLGAITKEWELKIKNAEQRAAELRMPSALAGLAGSDRDEVAARWEALTVSARKAAVRALMPDLELRRPPRPGMRATEAIEARVIPWPDES